MVRRAAYEAGVAINPPRHSKWIVTAASGHKGFDDHILDRQAMSERRSVPRFRSLLGARISFGRRRSTMDCLIRNIGPSGAMIVFPQSAITPTTFRLHILQRGETHSARVVWRGHDRAGLALSATEEKGVPIETASRMRRLQCENRRLRRQLDPGSW
jgi:hypothetical protein